MSTESNSDWVPWTCDSLTPDLCKLHIEEGFINLRGIDVHYWKCSAATSSSSMTSDDENNNVEGKSPQGFPIIAIHGGPGWPHNYMLPLKQQACRSGRDVYFYDQAGCGKSVIPSTDDPVSESSPEDLSGDSKNAPKTRCIENDYPWLLTTEYYTQEELPALIKHWGFKENQYHIIGNSWGTVLSQLFALDAVGVMKIAPAPSSMVLSGPFSDSQLYIKSQWDNGLDGTLGSLPPFVQERIHQLEESKRYNSTEYKLLDSILEVKFTCRTAPLPDCFLDSSEHFNEEIYVGMQGESEFTIHGVLENFNSTPRLHELAELPILLTHGQYDTMRPTVVDVMYNALPKSEKLLLKHSGHVSMIDEPRTMNDAIGNFFDRVESSLRSNQPNIPNQSDDGSGTHNVGTNIGNKSSSSSTSQTIGASSILSAEVKLISDTMIDIVSQPEQHYHHPFLVMGLSMMLSFCLGVIFERRRNTRRSDYQYTVLP